MNKVILVGNLTRDPEARTTQSGIQCTTFSIAVNRRFVNQQGVREADFINIVTWRQTAELCARYLAKGRKVGVVGSLQTRSYDAQDGSKRYVTEVVADEVEFLSTNGAGQSTPRPSDADVPPEPHTFQPKPESAPAAQPTGGFGGEDDDDLPF